MKGIEEYETIHDFWVDLSEAVQQHDFRMRPARVGREHLKTQSVARNLKVRLLVESGLVKLPTSLRVSHGPADNLSANTVTKLDFQPAYADQESLTDFTVIRIGHLLVSGPENPKPKGLEVTDPIQIPFDKIAAIDDGLDLLDLLTSED